MLRFVSWNVNQRRAPWHVLADIDADVALLQEASTPPQDVASRFDVGSEPWFTEGSGGRFAYRTALVPLNSRVRVDRIPTASIADAGPEALPVSRLGTLSLARVVDPDTGLQVTAISMYAFWEKPRTTPNTWIYADASVHRLISDISALVGTQQGHRLIAAGDLNSLYGYGEHGSAYWAGRYRTIFDRFDAIGLDYLGPRSPDGQQASPRPTELPSDSPNVPTFRLERTSESATRQLDFVFASRSIAARIRTRALNSAEEWGPSDHCRIRIDVR